MNANRLAATTALLSLVLAALPLRAGATEQNGPQPATAAARFEAADQAVDRASRMALRDHHRLQACRRRRSDCRAIARTARSSQRAWRLALEAEQRALPPPPSAAPPPPPVTPYVEPPTITHPTAG